MKKFPSLLILGLSITAIATHATTITVTTTNNVSPPAGQTSLKQALSSLHDGDVVTFNIPGTGPKYIATPTGGYPMITANNITIDGYTQPGASPNSNPILAPNNAKIQIVLDSRNGGSTPMSFEAGNGNSGYGSDESAILGVLDGTNFAVRGLCVLPAVTTDTDSDPLIYGVSFARNASGGHISGCWIGVDLNGTNVATGPIGISAFRYRQSDGTGQITINNTVIGVGVRSTNAPAEFNVIVGSAIPINIEGNGTRISGNFLMVLPDGLHDYDVAFDPVLTGNFQGSIEIGRGGDNTLIGTDGDGVNDANERNIIGGTVPSSLGGYPHNIEFYGNSPGTNIVVAGNYFGVGIDGKTYFTNGVPALNASGGASSYRFGSDLDGVSDSVEGNVVVNNYPSSLFPATDDTLSAPDHLAFFDELSAGASITLRGNVLINNYPFPTDPQKSGGTFLQGYYSQALVDSTTGFVPTISSNTTTTHLRGTIPAVNTNNYPFTIIDLYVADNVGITNGIAAGIPELPNGYVQGAAYLGSYVVGSASDLSTTPGSFDFNISSLNLSGGTVLTITANYAKTAAPTHNGLPLTSPFSDPVAAAGEALGPALKIATLGSSVVISWPTSATGFTIQGSSSLATGSWANLSPQPTPVVVGSSSTVTLSATGATQYYRLKK